MLDPDLNPLEIGATGTHPPSGSNLRTAFNGGFSIYPTSICTNLADLTRTVLDERPAPNSANVSRTVNDPAPVVRNDSGFVTDCNTAVLITRSPAPAAAFGRCELLAHDSHERPTGRARQLASWKVTHNAR